MPVCSSQISNNASLFFPNKHKCKFGTLSKCSIYKLWRRGQVSTFNHKLNRQHIRSFGHTVHCPKNNLNLRIKTYRLSRLEKTQQYISGFWARCTSIYTYITYVHWSMANTARFLCGDFDYFWDSVVIKKEKQLPNKWQWHLTFIRQIKSIYTHVI